MAQNYSLLQANPNVTNNVYYSDGSKVDPALIEEIEDLVEGLDKDNYTTTEKSKGDLFMYNYNTTLRRKYSSDSGRLRLLNESLRLAEGIVNAVEGSFSWFDSSAESDYEFCGNNQDLSWKGCGYKIILDILTKSYPNPRNKLKIDDKIYLAKRVVNINWGQSDVITVKTLDNMSYNCHYLIFTPSVGVLKDQHLKMFYPQLPFRKRQAIDVTGFGGVIKIAIFFPVKWWNDEDGYFSFLWKNEDIDTLITSNLSWVIHFHEMIKVPYNSNVWMGWISGTSVPEIELLPLETIKTGCNFVLNKFLGNTYKVKEIAEIMMSSWYSNENFKGTYSFTKTGHYNKNSSHQAKLAEPLTDDVGNPRILFAGEATHHKFYSTVHGAIESGYREAERIIKLHKHE